MTNDTREQLAKFIHAKFINMLQVHGRPADAQWMFVSYNRLSEPDRDDLRKQADEMLDLITHNDILREQLASIEHEQWAHWTDYMLHNMSSENAERWALQVKTSYDKLSEPEKDSDREWADRVLAVIRGEQV